MQKQFAISVLAKGIMEELDSRRISLSPFTYRPTSFNSHDIDELASSIRNNGLLNPIIVRMNKEKFEIVAGNRRYLACKKLGWRNIMCHIVEVDDKDAYELYLTENIQRKSFDPIEEARAFKTYVVDYGWGVCHILPQK